jgi:hypothetical protein
MKVAGSASRRAAPLEKRRSMGPCDVKPVVDWLIDGVRSAKGSADVLVELCERLVAAGMPLWRVAVFVNTLHPEIVGRRFLWRSDTGVIPRRSRPSFGSRICAVSRRSPTACRRRC